MTSLVHLFSLFLFISLPTTGSLKTVVAVVVVVDNHNPRFKFLNSTSYFFRHLISSHRLFHVIVSSFRFDPDKTAPLSTFLFFASSRFPKSHIVSSFHTSINIRTPKAQDTRC
ncbi:hypothetical protein F5148DRAFT_207936 [Russula earlei]|uniref:Uncharacterized protein n=1 Tax=Russula earlei TaxID=71964 RepID=A0ACC0U4E1_9AGAM|nr:hypothetical protein F5148DRAFT_207936 [Russula earlei]